MLDFDQIENDLRDLKNRFEITEVPFDPFQATQLSVRLVAEGFPMIEVGQMVRNLSEPMKHVEALVLSGTLHHEGCPVMTWTMSNVVCHVDAKENIYPRKQLPENKIDGPVALLMAVNRLMVKQDLTIRFTGLRVVG